MLKRAIMSLTISLLGLVAFGCSSTDTIDPQPIPNTIPLQVEQFTFPILNPTTGVIPLPNNLLTTSPGNSGRVMFPGTTAPVQAINSLDGFSTSGNILIPFTGPVDPATVNGNTVPLIRESNNARVACTYQVVNNAAGASTIVATPIRPLAARTDYVCVVTNGVRRPDSGSAVLSDNIINFSKSRTRLIDVNGNSVEPLLSNALANQLEPLRFAMQGAWAQAEGATGLTRENIPLAFRFGTQPLNQILPILRNDAVTNNNPLVPAALVTPAVWNAGLPAALQAALAPAVAALTAGNSRVGLGVISSNSYRTIPSLNSFWNTTVAPTPRNINYVAFLPAAGTNFPTIVFQHGITGSKELAAIVAAGANPLGFAVIAIDLELHGQLTEGANSGDGFINPANLRATRDNIRQSVVNLYYLNQAIVSNQSDLDPGAGVVSLAPAPPFFLGHSLGGIVGTIFTATETNLGRSVVNVAGGRLTALLLGSPTISPPILAGLAATDPNLVPGTPQFAQFFLIAQTVLDDADPLNYAAAAGAKTGAASILQQSLIADNVVPPSAQYDLATAMGVNAGFSQVNAIAAQALISQAAAPFTGSGLFEINNANHGVLLNPADGTPNPGKNQAVFGQIIAYFTTGQIQATAGIRAQGVFGALPADTTDAGSAVGFYP